MQIFTVFVLLIFICALFSALILPHVPMTQLIVPFFMLIAIPLMTYIGSKRNFKVNRRLSETIVYSFDETFLTLKGESFNAQLSWDKIHKVTQTKNWILIWQNNQIANPIAKLDLWDSQVMDMKRILDSHHVKNNL